MRLLVVLLLVVSFQCIGQQVEVRGRFYDDSVKIGVVLPYSLTASYPSNETVLFPDSTFSFTPFEIDHKEYFPTRTSGTDSYDSVVYYLSTFEIDSIQTLSLPVFVVEASDSTAVFGAPDTVFLKHLVAQLPDSVSVEQLPLKTNTAYQAVKWLLNYPLLLIAGAILVVAIAVVWIAFGKRIKKYFRVRKLRRNHEKFLIEFRRAVDELKNDYSNEKAESTLSLWKQYMERLMSSPITKYTSKEIYHLVKDDTLAQALKQIDRSIYRATGLEPLPQEPLIDLQEFSEKQFSNKVEEVKHG